LFVATGGKLAEKSKQKFLTAVERMKETCHDIKERAATGAEATNQTVQHYPYSTVGIAFGLGLVIGILARRK
ncbi:MAG: hypothetical protein JWR69_2751, partial [Pedosphaera sp.]|nr:hypothetical protein [Pedosphaera sp.]